MGLPTYLLLRGRPLNRLGWIVRVAGIQMHMAYRGCRPDCMRVPSASDQYVVHKDRGELPTAEESHAVRNKDAGCNLSITPRHEKLCLLR